MPLLDHFHPPLSLERRWESLHAAWSGSLADALNRVLPAGYFSEELPPQTWSPPAPALTVPAVFADVQGRVLACVPPPTEEENIERIKRSRKGNLPRYPARVLSPDPKTAASYAGNDLELILSRGLPSLRQFGEVLHAGDFVTGRPIILSHLRLHDYLGRELIGHDEVWGLVEARHFLRALRLAVGNPRIGQGLLNADLQTVADQLRDGVLVPREWSA
jgi:hypothetical protein